MIANKPIGKRGVIFTPKYVIAFKTRKEESRLLNHKGVECNS